MVLSDFGTAVQETVRESGMVTTGKFWILQWQGNTRQLLTTFALFLGSSIALQGGINFLSLWMKPLCVAIQMKAIEQYFHVVLFIMLYKVILTFKSVDETLVCDHSNETFRWF